MPAKQHSTRIIPDMMLEAGDTGEKLANRNIRGEAQMPAIEKALAAKKK